MTLTLDEARTIMREQFAPCVTALGIAVDAVTATGARLVMPNAPAIRRSGDTVCGQALMTLADTAMVFGVSAALGGMRPMTTVTQTTHFLRAIRDADIVAECRILRKGRNLVFGEVLIFAAGSSEPAVQVTSTYALIDTKPRSAT